MLLLALVLFSYKSEGAGGLEFNGTNNYVTFGAAPGLGASNFTLEVWFKRKGTGVGANTGSGGFQDGIPLLTKGRGEEDGTVKDMNYFLGISATSNVLAADLEEGSGQASPGLNHPIFGITPILTNVWYHGAVTYDGTTWRLYLNGALEAQSTVGQLPRWDNIQHAGLASAFDSAGNPAGFFQGVLDEARIWNYARSQQQIASNMVLQITGPAAGLLGRWGLEEGTGTLAVNSATNTANGILVNNPLWVAGYPFAVAPSVSITNPLGGMNISAPAALSVGATASDVDGVVTNVSFYAGTRLLGSSSGSPFSFQWTNPAPGSYTLLAIATDNSGLTGTSAPVNITLQNAVVTLTNPANNSVFIGPAHITLGATASDSNGLITLVEFRANSLKVGESSTRPFSALWSGVSTGTYILTAVATDVGGIQNTSLPVTVTVSSNTPPAIALTTPTNGATIYLPANLTITASASDIDGSVARVEFYASTNKIGEATSAPFSITWTNPPAGLFTLRAVATDDRGLTNTSSAVSITVATARLLRGPYLQMGGTNRGTVRWRTDVPTDGRVQFGFDPGSLDQFADDLAYSTDHVVVITNLLPDTKHYYSIGTSNSVLAANTNFFFVTAPLPNANKPLRLWVLGDPGTQDANQRAVRDAYYAYATNRPADLLMLLGDNAYNSGFDNEYQAALFDMYPNTLRNTFVWPTIGNHDTAQATTVSPTLPYFQMFSLPTGGECGGLASGTEKYYSFDYGPIHFICLDSQTSTKTPGSPMLLWLTNDLHSTTQPWLIAFWHHPTYTKRGGHDSDTETECMQMRQYVNPMLEAAGVDLVLMGHSHSYERSYLLNGHYGLSTTFSPTNQVDTGSGRTNETGAYLKPDGISANAGTVYCVAGSSGQISGGSGVHPANFLSLTTLGSLILDLNSNRLDVKFLSSAGSVQDYFTIVKGQANPPPTPANFSAVVITTNQIALAWSNTTNEMSWKIERSLDGANFSALVTIGANQTNYTNSSLAYDTRYYYRIRASNSAGDSPWSGIISARTPIAPVTTITSYSPLFQGIEHATATTLAGGFGDQRIHVLRIDLQDTNISLFSSPAIANPTNNIRETAGQTTGQFLTDYGVQAAINANYFSPCCTAPEGSPFDAFGFAMSQGQVVSAQEDSTYSTSMVFTTNNIPTLIVTNWPPTNGNGIFTAVSGKFPLVVHGTNVAGSSTVNPRTAMGYSQDKRYLLLMTIDGRQPGYAEGTQDFDTAAWMLRFGAYDAVNLDGGGSTTMVISDGHGGANVLNRPIDGGVPGQQRVIANSFGIYARPYAPAGIAAQPQSQVVTVGSPAAFSVTVTGSPPFSYQWRLNGNNIPGATNSLYAISSVQDVSAGIYSVLAGNTQSVLSAGAVLTVNHSPTPVARAFARQPLARAKARITELLGTDPDGDPVFLLSAGPASAQNGTVRTNGAWVFYTPPGGYTNSDLFAVVSSDGRGGVASNLVTVTIQPDNSVIGNFGSTLLPGGTARLSFNGIPGRAYAVQYSDNLGTTNWQPLATSTAGSSGIYTYEDTPPKGAPPRIYRSIPTP